MVAVVDRVRARESQKSKEALFYWVRLSILYSAPRHVSVGFPVISRVCLGEINSMEISAR